MWHSDRVDPIVKIGALTPPHNPFTENIHLWNSWVFPLALLIFLHTPNIAWAEENYYQIINGSVDAINNNFITDRGYSVYVNYDGSRFLYDVGYKKKSFLGNLKAAGISLAELDFIALSHRHQEWPYLFTTNSHTDFFMKIEKAKQLTGQKVFPHSGHTARRISADDTIVANAKKMKSMGVKRVSPSHSKPSHDKIFEEIFGTEYIPAIVGKKVPLEPVP
jgi:metal-dependent hydrolase (beta-lactamase superfamily II)